jgi:hypothetical protein
MGQSHSIPPGEWTGPGFPAGPLPGADWPVSGSDTDPGPTAGSSHIPGGHDDGWESAWIDLGGEG